MNDLTGHMSSVGVRDFRPLLLFHYGGN